MDSKNAPLNLHYDSLHKMKDQYHLSDRIEEAPRIKDRAIREPAKDPSTIKQPALNAHYDTLHEMKNEDNSSGQIKENSQVESLEFKESEISEANNKAYSSKTVTDYFTRKPLLRRKADEIQYNLNELEKIGQGNSGIVYKIPNSELWTCNSSIDSIDEQGSRVLKVIKQVNYFHMNDPDDKMFTIAFESSYQMLLKEFDIWNDMMKNENLRDKIVQVHSLRTCWTNSKYSRTDPSYVNFSRMNTKEVGIETEKMEMTLDSWLRVKVENDQYDVSLVCDVMKQIIACVKSLHDNHYLHNDIAIRNFLVDQDGRIKISDFGLSKKLIQNENQTFSESSDEQTQNSRLRFGSRTPGVRSWESKTELKI